VTGQASCAVELVGVEPAAAQATRIIPANKDADMDRTILRLMFILVSRVIISALKQIPKGKYSNFYLIWNIYTGKE
jgi:hypothetical protein